MATTTVEVDIPDELVPLLKSSRLGDRPVAEQLRVALAIQLMLEGIISTGKAASIAGMNRFVFEELLLAIGVPAIRYGLAEYRQDRESLEKLRRM